METIWLTESFIILAIIVVAILYSSVGHGGASGYLAVMAFFGGCAWRNAPDGFDFEHFRRVNRRFSILSARLF